MGIKRLHVYLIKGYLGNFLAIFFVCLFIVLMQFLWKYVDDMVGKGLSLSVLFHFFYYAALSLVPMALPLSVLLSSLMNFGSLGERLELLAMKASGISLFRIMAPYIFFIACIAVGGFFYSENALPYIQKQLYILSHSMAEKTPEVQIPEGSFYQGIPNISIYVRNKDTDTKLLRNVMIYDFSNNSGTSGPGANLDNISIICADTATIASSSDHKSIVLTLLHGQTFENMKVQGANGVSGSNRGSIPYRRESFRYKQVLIDFDGSWKQLDASITNNSYVGKNIEQLTYVVDSLHKVSKLLSDSHVNMMVNDRYFGRKSVSKHVSLASLGNCNAFDYKKFFNQQPLEVQRNAMSAAAYQAHSLSFEIDYMYDEKDYAVDRKARRHDIERNRKFTMSVACVLFLFIGAPLGAIIRKGGFGLPIVISVLIFILYYVVDNTGYKMAREGVWYVASGIWMSSALLLVLGSFLTYKAATDSMVNLNKETFRKLLPKFLRKDKNNLDNNGTVQS